MTKDDHKRRYEQFGNDIDSVTEIIDGLGLSRDYGSVPEFYSIRGRAVHKAVELIDKGTLDDDSVDPQIVPYVMAYQRFLKESWYVPLAWEVPLYHDKLNYAGTIDKVGQLNGRLGVLDIKTSSSVDPAVEYQLCAYKVLWDYKNPETPALFRYALQLRDDGDFRLIIKYSKTPVKKWLTKLDEWKSKKLLLPGPCVQMDGHSSMAPADSL